MDTCTRRLNLALVDQEGEVLGEVGEDVTTHATRLVPAIDSLLKKVDAGPADVTAIGVTVGPGSFTGIRIGIATALGMARAGNIPVYPIDSLTALAKRCKVEGRGAVLLDARRSQVYLCTFLRRGAELQPAGEAVAMDTSKVLQGDPGYRWVVGDGIQLVEGWPASCRLITPVPNAGLSAAKEAMEAFSEGRPGVLPKPVYVRRPDARPPV